MCTHNRRHGKLGYSSVAFTTNLKGCFRWGPRSRLEWNRAIPLAESHKLNPWLLDDDPRPKSGKLKLNLYGSSLEGNRFVQTKRKSSKERAHDLENQDAHEAPPPRHGPTQGFNLLQISPNWFLGIWTLDPI